LNLEGENEKRRFFGLKGECRAWRPCTKKIMNGRGEECIEYNSKPLTIGIIYDLSLKLKEKVCLTEIGN